MSAFVPIDISSAAASSVERCAEVLEGELRWLDSLERQAGLAARDEPDFLQWHGQIRDALRALRGDFNPITSND